MSVLRISFLLALCCTAVLQGASAQAQGAPSAPQIPTFTRIAAPADNAAIPLYTGQAPGSEGRAEPEVWNLMAGNRVVRNVVQPTITPVLPASGKATGAAVIVVAGGGFQFLSLDVEGWPIARWLADHGIAAFVLKYRLNETPGDEKTFSQKMIATFMAAMSGPDKSLPLKEPLATADVLQAISMVRSSAEKWQVDPARVGVMGFSAGAVATLDAAMAPDVSARPAFVGYIYGPMSATKVPADAPPMFAAIAMDDSLFGRQGFGVIESWRAAKRPVELHAYEKGEHAFGMGRPHTTTQLMMPQFLAWLDARDVLKPTK